jgi:hypothetical protein
VFTPAAEEPTRTSVPELPCGDCGRARLLDPDSGTVSCETAWCSASGVPALLWRALDVAGVDHNPAGALRAIHRGVPVPWIVPVISGSGGAVRPQWRMIHRGRLGAAQQQWLCQHCGLPADQSAAVVFVDDQGRCLTPAPLHRGECATVSAACCPHLARIAATAVVIAHGQEHRRGEVAPEIGLTQNWHVPAGTVRIGRVAMSGDTGSAVTNPVGQEGE